MNLTAWLIGDKAESILNDLTAPDGYPPAQIWIPLDRTLHYATKQLPRYRSAWAHRTTGTEQWVDFAAAADTIAEAVGPHALANPRSITLGKALLSNVQTRDGILMAKVPRYFSTVATDWTFDQVGQDPHHAPRPGDDVDADRPARHEGHAGRPQARSRPNHRRQRATAAATTSTRVLQRLGHEGCQFRDDRDPKTAA